MHPLRNAVLSAPIIFLVLASFRQAVRLACFAAASLATWAAEGVAADDSAAGGAAAAAGFTVEDAGAWGAAG